MRFARTTDELKAEIDGLNAHIISMRAEHTRLRGIVDLFDSEGWDKLQKYLKEIRLQQLRIESGKQLQADETTRAILRGQIIEIEFLIGSYDELSRAMKMVEKKLQTACNKADTAKKKIERMLKNA